MSLAQHRLLKSTDAAFGQALGITATQLGVLFILEENPGALLKDVSDVLGINKSAITTLVDRMETAGLVRRQPSAHDGRAVHLLATREGLAKAAAARPILARLNSQLTEGFDEREITTIGRFLQSILERF
jgi:DNA-binding MarR family transcriptional regulator